MFGNIWPWRAQFELSPVSVKIVILFFLNRPFWHQNHHFKPPKKVKNFPSSYNLTILFVESKSNKDTTSAYSGCHKYVPFGFGCYHLKMNMHNGIKRIKLMTTAISSFLFLKDLTVCKQRIRICWHRRQPSYLALCRPNQIRKNEFGCLKKHAGSVIISKKIKKY